MAAAGDVSSLPAELLQIVSGRLSADADLLHIHQVCAHWRASTSQLSTCHPWIIAGREPWQEIGPTGEYSFWLRSGGRAICSGAPAGLPYCCGASHGWLALADCTQSPKRLILWEPISKAEILLPPLPAVAQIYLSGDPLASPSGWTAVATQKTPGPCRAQKLFYWRPVGVDVDNTAWSPLLDRATSRIDSAAFHQGRAYFVYTSWQLDIFDLETSPPWLIRDTFLYNSLSKLFRAPNRSRHQVLRTLHVVPCGGECMLVVTYGGRRPPPAEVYRADWEAEPLVEIRERVTDLGERSMFVGRGDAFILSAREFPAVRRNCLYYVDHDEFEPQPWATLFDLGSKTWEQIPYPEELWKDGGVYWRAYSWFCLKGPLLKEHWADKFETCKALVLRWPF